MNKVFITGRIGSDLVVKKVKVESNDGRSEERSVLNFRVAVDYGPRGEHGRKTVWTDVTAWGGAADTIGTHLKKGEPICLTGELQDSTYEKDGVKHKGDPKIQIDEFEFIGGKKEAA
jgi:single-stranded DNA-binding protein